MNNDRIIPAAVCFLIAAGLFAFSASHHGVLDFLYGLLIGCGVGFLFVGMSGLRKIRDGIALMVKR